MFHILIKVHYGVCGIYKNTYVVASSKEVGI